MKELLLKLLGIAGKNVADEDKAALDALKAEIAAYAEGAGVEIPEGAEDAKHNATYIKQLTELVKAQNAELAALKQAQQNVLAQTKEEKEAKEKQELSAKVQAEIEAAKKDGRIPPQNETVVKAWETQLTANFDTAKQLLDAAPKSATQQQQNGGGGNGGKDENAAPRVTGGAANPKILAYVQEQMK